MNNMLLVGAGGAGVVGIYLLYVAITKGAPAAWAIVKTWWTKGATEAAALKGDLAALESRVVALEQKILPHAAATPPAGAPAPAAAAAPATSATPA